MTTNPNPTLPARPRASGILLHPTSLPGPYGIGDLGPAAYEWVEALVKAKQSWWQMLPLGPTGYGDSPYQCFSAFAGNPYLVSPEQLLRDGLLTQTDVAPPLFPADKVDFGPVIEYKVHLLQRAWDNYQAGTAPGLRPLFSEFCKTEAHWLDDYALFMALKDSQGGRSWLEWPTELIMREPAALKQAMTQHGLTAAQHQFRQFLFFRQWRALKEYANGQGIQLIGDVPIFISSDSADVWAHPELFQLDAQRRPTFVAGVPPDYFSATGQLWGNPLYDWAALEKTGYAWWIARMRAAFGMVDLIRLDHFRGFEAYWEIPAGNPTAEIGRWVKGPGDKLFHALKKALGNLSLIAEDLGVITPEVERLREQFHLPGMRILQFAFGGATEDRFLPHLYEHNTVVYTGTHDNETTLGWFAAASPKEQAFCRKYLGLKADAPAAQIVRGLLRLAWASVADLAVAPLQDILTLGPEARMNLPGSAAGNWGWRFQTGQLTDQHLADLADLTDLFARSTQVKRKE